MWYAVKHNKWDKGKWLGRNCGAPCANTFLQTATYLQDKVVTIIANLGEESSVFGADLCFHKNCIEGSSSYFSGFCDTIFLVRL